MEGKLTWNSWGKVVGVKAVFEQISADEYRKKMESIGFPPTLAQGMAELAEVISGPGNYVEAVDIVKGREVSFYLLWP
jgi:hypothetical protein